MATSDKPAAGGAVPPEPAWRRWARMAATLGLAAAGGWIAQSLGLPLPWLLGALIALCLAAVADLRILGGPPTWPSVTRTIFFPVLGVMIGSSFSAEILAGMWRWWPALGLLTLYVAAAHALAYMLLRRLGGYDRTTAFFAASPGGFVDAILLGARSGGQERLIILQHFLRMFVIVLIVPLLFWAVSGRQVGSAAGFGFSGADLISPTAALLLATAALIGTLAARAIRLPAPEISGAIVLSAALYATGTVTEPLPPLVLKLAQLLIGTSLGVGFVGIARPELMRAMALALVSFCCLFSLSLGAALLLGRWLDVGMGSILLAFAPGGLAEMNLIALSLGLSAPFVTLMHLYRIFLAVIFLPWTYRWLIAGRS